MNNILLKVFLPLIPAILAAATPVLRNMIQEFALAFYKKAKETENPYDDFLAGIVLALLQVDVP